MVAEHPLMMIGWALLVLRALTSQSPGCELRPATPDTSHDDCALRNASRDPLTTH